MLLSPAQPLEQEHRALYWCLTDTTAKAGNYQPDAENISDASTVGKNLIKAADEAKAREAIGAGTSTLAIGVTSSTAKAGDYQPTAANISDAGDFGRQLLQAATQTDAKTLLGIE